MNVSVAGDNYGSNVSSYGRSYTEAELKKAVQEEREAFIEMINYKIILPEVPKKLLLEAIRQRGEKL